MSTYSFRVDDTTKALIMSTDFRIKYGSISKQLHQVFDLILQQDYGKLYKYHWVDLSTAQALIQPHLHDTEKVSIQLDNQVKQKLNQAFATNKHLQWIAKDLSTLCKQVARYDAYLLPVVAKMRPSIHGRAVAKLSDHEVSYLSIYQYDDQDSALWVPGLQAKYHHLQNQYELHAAIIDAKRQIKDELFKLGPHEQIKNLEMVDYVPQTNDSIINLKVRY